MENKLLRGGVMAIHYSGFRKVSFRSYFLFGFTLNVRSLRFRSRNQTDNYFIDLAEDSVLQRLLIINAFYLCGCAPITSNVPNVSRLFH